MLFVRLFDLRMFGFVCFLFLLGLGSAAAGLNFFSYLFCDCGTPRTFLLSFFTISVIVCLCMCVLFWIAVWPVFWERNCPFGFLCVVF